MSSTGFSLRGFESIAKFNAREPKLFLCQSLPPVPQKCGPQSLKTLLPLYIRNNNSFPAATPFY